MLKCRKTITGQKIWGDNDDMHGKRPSSIEIKLLRDGKDYDTITIFSKGDGSFVFPCVPIRKNSGDEYVYSVDETEIPDGYRKTIQGFNITNTLDTVTINGTKTWVDNVNPANRPAEITVNLLQNGAQFDTKKVTSPAAGQSTSEFNFPNLPVFDTGGKAFTYTIDELDVLGYKKKIDGFNITNTLE